MTASAASHRLTLLTASLCAMLVLGGCRPAAVKPPAEAPPETRRPDAVRIYQPPLPSRPPTA